MSNCGFVEIRTDDYRKYCELQGAFMAAQRYLDGCDYPYVDVLINIIGLDNNKMNHNRKVSEVNKTETVMLFEGHE